MSAAGESFSDFSGKVNALRKQNILYKYIFLYIHIDM